jgi:predicted nucleic acid-binding Zn ribbon protein
VKEFALHHEDDSNEIIKEIAARQRYGRKPKRIADVLSRLIAKKGYGRLQATTQFEQAWAEAVGPDLAKLSKPGRLRRGTLEVTVRNSTVSQELQFNKQQLLGKLQASVTDCSIQDIRFRVGTID